MEIVLQMPCRTIEANSRLKIRDHSIGLVRKKYNEAHMYKKTKFRDNIEAGRGSRSSTSLKFVAEPWQFSATPPDTCQLCGVAHVFVDWMSVQFRCSSVYRPKAPNRHSYNYRSVFVWSFSSQNFLNRYIVQSR